MMAKQTTKGGKPAPTTKFERGFTAQAPGKPEERPPSLKGRVYNEFRPDVARGSTMPPPTGDTQEPRMSKRLGKAKGGKR
jgi:hypothetical protein